jgi:hypothetical protein
MTYRPADESQRLAQIIESRTIIKNLFDYRPDSNDFLVSTFAISNVMNDREAILPFIKRFGGIYALPFDRSAWWPNGIEQTYVEGKMRQKSYHDWTFTNLDFLNSGLYIYDISTFVAGSYFNENMVAKRRDSFRGCPVGPEPGGWMVVSTEPLFDVRFQNWLNAQTHFVKDLTLIMRHSLGHGNGSTHVLRQYVMANNRYPGTTVEVLGERGVHGHVTFDNGKDVYVSVAGHAINLLLYSKFGVFDIDRWLNTIMWNVEASLGYAVVPEHVFSEFRSPKFLWHSYLDWWYATFAYEIALQEMRLRPDTLGAKLRALIQKTLERYPNWLYTETNSAKKYRATVSS